ncbi:MAG: hypothetical protein GXO97_08655 [Nitrospirae bacterium]|nr:hypothetical protein [Nitrospirota bacterium]
MSYRRPINLTLIYTLPFIVTLVVLTVFLTIWSIHKHKEEQIRELTETGRALSRYITDNLDKIDNPLISTFIDSNKSAINFNLLKISESKKSDNLFRHNNSIEIYNIKDSGNSRVFQYQKKISQLKNGKDYILSIEIPMELSDKIHRDKIERDILSFITIGIFSVIFIIFAIWRLSKRISSGIDKEMEEIRLRALIELAGATAHEMRQPLAIVTGFSDLLKDKIERGEDTEEDIKIIKEQCLRMDDIIKKMLNITHYKTIRYTDGVKILDLNVQPTERLN